MIAYIKRHMLVYISIIIFAVSGSANAAQVTDASKTAGVETIIIIRHAEKPKAGLGQLSVTGLKRSLLLPDFFKNNFPRPDYIFAPNPAVKHYENHGDKKYHYYVRPLLTIAPTAITLGMPVHTGFGLDATNDLVEKLLAPEYHSSTIIVAWEHSQIVQIAEMFIEHFHSDAKVPKWSNKNFNMFFVFTIDWNKKHDQLNFEVKSEGFHDLSDKAVHPTYLD
jgi:hypothetical protein